jgi:aryl-alcohol dehydrogenase-like predicted oxidoreductase
MKFILGTVQFGLKYGINNSLGKPSQIEVNSILDYAFECGVKLLDTAEAYGDSQEVIGKYHKESHNRFDIITKFSSKRNDLDSSLTKRISQNLETLKVDYLYSYMFHSFSDFKLFYPEFKCELMELKRQNIIKKIGVSVYTNEEIQEVIKNNNEVDLIQMPFNLLDNNTQRLSIIKKMKEREIEVHTRSVFLQGLFFKEQNQLPLNLQMFRPYLEQLRSIASSHSINLNDLSIGYVNQQEGIDKILLGVDSVDQLKRNVLALKIILPKGVSEKIDSIEVSDKILLNPSNWSK